jgi:uncharacterized repeat protein (TIGR01451 family)
MKFKFNISNKISKRSTTMENKTAPKFKTRNHSTLRRAGTSSLAMMVFAAQVTPALATINNTATASGTYGVGPATTATSNTINVTVASPVTTLTVLKYAALPTTNLGTNTSKVDAGDTITFSYTVQNTGNVTMTGVTPTDVGPKFNGLAGTNVLGSFTGGTSTLAPGQTSALFYATYTLSAIDVARGAGIPSGVTNTASATATPANGSLGTVTGGGASTTIAANPALTVVKSFSIADNIGGTAGQADVGEVITYTYKVKNVGNVAMTGIQISDLHVATTVTSPVSMLNETILVGDDGPLAGASPAVPSTDAIATNGIWSILQPGATVTFTWTHTVTQAEFDAG